MAKTEDKKTDITSKKSETKLRLLYLAKILYEESDKNHKFSTNELIDRLEKDHGIKSHRTTISEDIETLIQFGIKIKSERSSQMNYYVEERLFKKTDIKILSDFVSNNATFSESKTKALIKKLGTLVSKHEKKEIDHSLSENKNKNINKIKGETITEALNEAYNTKRKIRFCYSKYAIIDNQIVKCRTNDGFCYTFSPYGFYWRDGKYYVIGYSDKHRKVVSFRVDRIDTIIDILDLKYKIPSDFDIEEHISTMLHMYDSKRVKVELYCKKDCFDAFIDKFGTNIEIRNNGPDHFRAFTVVAVNHIFYSWVFGFKGAVKIVRPDNVRNEYKKMLEEEIDRYNY